MGETFNGLDLAVTDFSDLLALPEGDVIGAPIAPLGDRYCPYHPGADDCACHGFLEDWDLPSEPIEPTPQLGLAEPDYSKFENYIPRFIRPQKPCEYCRSKRMSCYVQRGEGFCTPCALLSRECSFFASNELAPTAHSRPSTSRNHFSNPEILRVVSEDATRPDPSRANSNPKIPFEDDAPGTTKTNGIRFPKHAVKILRDWLDAHASNPYPTEDEKIELEMETELKPSQIANWLANARRRRKVTERSRPKLAMSPSLRPTTSAIPIPGAAERCWDELNPLERWKNSPPENEPASMSDIANALASTDIPDGDASASASPSTLGRYNKRKTSSNGSRLSNARPQSVTSCETGRTSSLSASSAAFSNGSSHSTHGSFSSFNSSLAGKKDRRRRRRPVVAKLLDRKPSDDKKRIFQCTFCTDTFKSKYDWTRHEKSLHLSLEKWICAPQGPIITDQETGGKKCAYCDLHNPSSDHIESHNHRQCEDKGLDARTFYRKDHLRQHLRLMHACEMAPSTESWKSVAQNINSRCGFCAQRFSIWQERVDHLTAHFKAGVRMAEWKGCRGLDPAVAAQVTNAMPPYLIGMESVTPNPFSATNRASWRSPEEFGGGQEGPLDVDPHAAKQAAHCRALLSSSNWEILTIRLGQFAKAQADKGIPITDDMLQRQARKIIYDSDDSWNQTPADHPEWLDLFKRAHGLNFIPTSIGGEGTHVPASVEMYSNLGVRVPFAAQLRAFNDLHCNSSKTLPVNLSDEFKAAIEKRREECRNVYNELRDKGVFYDGDQKCGHAECGLNMIDVSPFDGMGIEGPRAKRWCSRDVVESAGGEAQLRQQQRRQEVGDSTVWNNLSTSLTDLDERWHQTHGSCCPSGPNKDLATSSSRSGLASSSNNQSPEIQASIARARGLAALARIEALEDQPEMLREGLKREWEVDQRRALMGGAPLLLGGNMGAFAEDGDDFTLNGSSFQPTAAFDNGDVYWPPAPAPAGASTAFGENAAAHLSQEEMMAQLDELINASTAPQATDAMICPPTTCGAEVDAAWASGNMDLGLAADGDEGEEWATTTMDFMMDDVEFGNMGDFNLDMGFGDGNGNFGW